jgi:NAD(P)-dependent dehydrogenase (short-subunit alcohol dehydrogenase family)
VSRASRARSRCGPPVVVITGAGRGIGRATAEAFGAAGWQVVVAEKNAALGRASARALARRGIAALFVPTDVADGRSIERMTRRVLERCGRIDCLVNNAGVIEQGPLVRLSVADVQHLLAVNLAGLLLVSRAVLPSMLGRRSGAIVNVASLLGKFGMSGYVVYCATKFGVVGLTEVLADEVSGTGVAVWAVCQGQVDTPMARKVGASRRERESLIRPSTVAGIIVALATGRRRERSGSVPVRNLTDARITLD